MATGTLSVVITSCLGTSRVLVLISTFIDLSTIGHTITIPGPLKPTALPNLKTINLSYSFTIFIPFRNAIRKIKNKITIIPIATDNITSCMIIITHFNYSVRNVYIIYASGYFPNFLVFFYLFSANASI